MGRVLTRMGILGGRGLLVSLLRLDRKKGKGSGVEMGSGEVEKWGYSRGGCGSQVRKEVCGSKGDRFTLSVKFSRVHVCGGRGGRGYWLCETDVDLIAAMVIHKSTAAK